MESSVGHGMKTKLCSGHRRRLLEVWIKEKMFILDEKTFLTVVGVIAQ